ncbi:MAG: hypothetical protein ACYC5J_15870, partial [Chloroflexota bacterium]
MSESLLDIALARAAAFSSSTRTSSGSWLMGATVGVATGVDGVGVVDGVAETLLVDVAKGVGHSSGVATAMTRGRGVGVGPSVDSALEL